MGIIERQIKQVVADFHLPRYDDLPRMGLYLDQVVRYVNAAFPPAMGVKITNTMVSSYVKRGLLSRPQQRLYGREQVISLLLIAVGRQILPLDDLHVLFQIQRHAVDLERAYNYFCVQFEITIKQTFGLATPAPLMLAETEERRLMDRFVQMVSDRIYLRLYLAQFQDNHNS